MALLPAVPAHMLPVLKPGEMILTIFSNPRGHLFLFVVILPLLRDYGYKESFKNSLSSHLGGSVG